MKRAIVINRSLSVSDILNIRRLAESEENLRIFSTSSFAYPFPVEIISQDATEKRAINYSEMDRLLAFGDAKTGDTSMAEFLSVSGMSLWHYHKFRIYFIMRNQAYEEALIRDLALVYDEIHLYTSFNDFQLFGNLPENVVIVPGAKTAGHGKSIVSLLHYLTYLLLRFFIGMASTLKAGECRHLLIDRSARQPCLDPGTLKLKQDNYNLAYVFAKAGKDFAIIDETEPPKFSQGQQFRIERWMIRNSHPRVHRIPGEFILIRGVLSPAVWKAYKKDEKLIYSRLRSLIEEAEPGRNNWILKKMLEFHGASRFYIFKNRAYNMFFRNHEFKTVTSIDENSPSVKSILDAARVNGMKTIGIQHGNIHDLHPAYRFTSADLRRGLLCDVTLVWGSYWKDYLINKSGYPETSLEVVGQPRTDIIPALLNNCDKLIKELGYPEVPLVVFASQLQQDPLLREKAAFDVLNMAASFSDIHLVIKLHPSEASDPEYYHRIARQTGCTNYSITSEHDLYSLIASCNMLITCFSTVGAETVYFRKPLVILDHLDQDIQAYIKQGVAFRALNGAELTKVAEGILSRELSINDKAYESFIQRNAFSIDGRTSERIVDFIRCMF
ncbi:MAG: CDP-glycerol glycerophosphotransferase family protein [Lentimicrobium sp.]|uniref:CDP-glycerol glycerophosphotransferase family protein n=1 Tax=Lentimicrobium sp. TaxID=2034841 RepID=UPI0025EB8534|nr:CDP-glycerol glycerophosphotransferase family protein [Lentimicrobium sp.]MCO5257123.1 CDP-glycerol glycerophosphotransferase family protein [Lentimicrobium sp.]